MSRSKEREPFKSGVEDYAAIKAKMLAIREADKWNGFDPFNPPGKEPAQAELPLDTRSERSL
jgi:hypothetical protein